MNEAFFRGNLTRDIEIRYLDNGNALGSSAIAVNRRYKNKNNEEVNEVMFMDIYFWGKLAEIVNQYTKKGSDVIVQGRIVFQQWQDAEGTNRSKHCLHVEKFQMLDKKDESTNNTGINKNHQTNPSNIKQQQVSMQKNYNEQNQNAVKRGEEALEDLNFDTDIKNNNINPDDFIF